MLLSAGEDQLTLSCFDYEVSARVVVDAEVIEPGQALVPGRLLAEITRSLPARPVEFSDEADVVNLTCGRAEFGLVCLQVKDYPVLPESPPAIGIVDGGVLAAAVTQVAPSASRDDTLPLLTAVCLDVSGPRMTLAATDRYRLAVTEVPVSPAQPDVRAAALVPARLMTEAVRTLSTGVPVTIAFGSDDAAQPRPAEGLISFETRDRRFTARLIAGDFIKYQSRFPDEFGCRADLPAGPVIEAVRRAALVAERAGPVRLSFRPGQVMVEAHAEGRARAAETVPAEFTGDQPVISFNPHYLLDGLTAAALAGAGAAAAASDAGEPPMSERGQAEAAAGQHAGEEAAAGGRIRLEFNTPAKPALITWTGASEAEAGAAADAGDREGGTAFRYLLVPLRVPERA
jgi:DNA polymerase-3 subunit beta